MTPQKHAILEHSKIELKARAEVLFQKFKQLYNLKFELGLMGNDPYGKPFTDLRDQISQLRTELKNFNRRDNLEYVWLTVSISPKWCNDFMMSKTNYKVPTPSSPASLVVDEHKHHILLKKMNDALLAKALKYASSAMFDEYIFVFEQREPEFNPASCFVGQHFHFLLKRSKSYCYSQIVRNTKNVWRKFCNVDNGNILNIHKCPAEFVKDKIQYCLGEKTGDGKDCKVAVDQQFRDLFHYEKSYHTDYFLNK